MIKNSEFNGSVDTNPYKFRHYDIIEISPYVNGRRVPSEGLSLVMDHEKRLSLAIGHSLKGPDYITRTRVYRFSHMFINGFFMLHENGNIRMELQLSRPLPEYITCLLFLE